MLNTLNLSKAIAQFMREIPCPRQEASACQDAVICHRRDTTKKVSGSRRCKTSRALRCQQLQHPCAAVLPQHPKMQNTPRHPTSPPRATSHPGSMPGSLPQPGTSLRCSDTGGNFARVYFNSSFTLSTQFPVSVSERQLLLLKLCTTSHFLEPMEETSNSDLFSHSL